MADITVNSKSAFLGKRNEALLDKLLTDDFQRRLGTDLSDKETARLHNTVSYYMKEVYSDSDNTGKSLQEMNREVLKAVVPDFQSYIRRQQAPTAPPAGIVADVNSQFDRIQSERQEAQARPPAAPVFQLTLDDKDSVPSIQRYEQLKQQRELEARRLEEAQTTLAPLNTDAIRRSDQEEIMNRIQSDDDFRASQRNAANRDASVLSAREADRARQRQAAGQVVRDVPPDPRALYDQPMMNPLSNTLPNANPTLSLPNYVQARPSLPQDIIKPQNDIVAYKENEYNLMIYSGDRDWVNNTLENRYNFTVNFDPANNRQGFGLSPSTYIKFKNIARIELVKAIMATEGLETVSLKSGTASYDTSKIINVLSFPYLQVRIDELNTNNYGTNDGVNNSFGVINYDAYWTSDQTLKNKGYTCLIPKFLKCQKIYHPTPLATLQRLSIQIQRPDGSLVTEDKDALDISGVVLSSMLYGSAFGWGGATRGGSVTGSYYNETTNSTTTSEYIWIQTKTWFSQFSVTQGDRIVLGNLVYPSAITASTTEFLTYLQRAAGHVVVDVGQSVASTAVFTAIVSNGSGSAGTILNVSAMTSGTIFIGMKINTGSGGYISGFTSGTLGGVGLYTVTVSQLVSSSTITGSSVNFQDGANGSNKLGYSNFIIIRNQFSDPTTGATTPVALNSAFGTAISATPGLYYGRLLNTSHQLQLVFRVITRDLDSSTRLRPDNL
jgi:hypothetical protein